MIALVEKEPKGIEKMESLIKFRDEYIKKFNTTPISKEYEEIILVINLLDLHSEDWKNGNIDEKIKKVNGYRDIIEDFFFQYERQGDYS